MKNEKLPRRSLELSPEEWETLEWLATHFKAIPPTRNEPSWRTLIKMIAREELIIKEKGQ